jgi:hypothetical protein
MMQFLAVDRDTTRRIICSMSVTAERFATVGDMAAISAGYPFRGAVDALEPGHVAVVQMRNVEADDVDWASLARVNLPSKRQPDYLTAGDVIFTTRGRRNFALSLNEVPGPAVCSPHFFILRVFSPGTLLPEFLAWQINQRPAQEYLQQAATGSHILNITRSAIESLLVAIPPIELQRQVVDLAEAAQRERQILRALVDNRQRELDVLANQILTPERFSAA